ncbi:MAG: N-methyl-D-aspartate receptor NMDAR2C subunit [Prosthecobacter sp.]
MRTSLEHWTTLWQRLGATGDGSACHSPLIGAWSEPRRAYHTLQHLDECLCALDVAVAYAEIPNRDAIEAALWFHDAVYDPTDGDNELRSAELARCELELAAVSQAIIADVWRLILVTQTHRAELTDEFWMVDIDLSILGQSETRFGEYEQQIRAEYAWVAEAVYREKRSEIMRCFLERERLYHTPLFHDRFEEQARQNLARLIEWMA